jgi:hypothetical protein
VASGRAVDGVDGEIDHQVLAAGGVHDPHPGEGGHGLDDI